LRRSQKHALLLIVVITAAVLGAAYLLGSGVSGGLTSSITKSGGPAEYSTAVVKGNITGQVETVDGTIAKVNAIFFSPLSDLSKQFSASVSPDGSYYSVNLPNGENYTILLNVIDPNNAEETGVCAAPTISLDNMQQATYVIDLVPFAC